jgi:hypothetical protein
MSEIQGFPDLVSEYESQKLSAPVDLVSQFEEDQKARQAHPRDLVAQYEASQAGKASSNRPTATVQGLSDRQQRAIKQVQARVENSRQQRASYAESQPKLDPLLEWRANGGGVGEPEIPELAPEQWRQVETAREAHAKPAWDIYVDVPKTGHLKDFAGRHGLISDSLDLVNKGLVQPFEKSAAAGRRYGADGAENMITHPLEMAKFLTLQPVNPWRPSGPKLDLPDPVLGVARGVGGTLGGLVADPRQWPFLFSGEALLPEAFQTVKGAVDNVESAGELFKLLRRPDASAKEKWEAGAEFAINAAHDLHSAAHAVKGHHSEEPAGTMMRYEERHGNLQQPSPARAPHAVLDGHNAGKFSSETPAQSSAGHPQENVLPGARQSMDVRSIPAGPALRIERQQKIPVQGEPKPPSPAERRQVGKTEAVSKRKVLQATDSIINNERLAAQAAPHLQRALLQLTDQIRGTRLARLRPEKNLVRAVAKVREGKPPETISDYLAAQIAVDSPRAEQQMTNMLRRNFHVVDVDAQMKGRSDKGGFASSNIQIEMPNGLTAEVQLVPREVQSTADKSHYFYTKGREARDAGNQKGSEFYFREARRINDVSRRRYERRNGIR